MSKPLKSLHIANAANPLSISVVLATTFLVFLTFGCNKKMTEDKMPKTRLEFGHGGGFTGAVTTYILLENGRMYEGFQEKKDYKRLHTIPKDETKLLYEACEKLFTLKTDAPGNMYYFVTMKKGDEAPRRWIFGDPSTATPQELETLYKRLVGYAPTQK
jgi:hypothetical protein